MRFVIRSDNLLATQFSYVISYHGLVIKISLR